MFDRIRRPWTLLLVLVVALVVAGVYIQAVGAHVGVYRLQEASVTMTGVTPTEQGDALTGTIRFTNPTSQTVTMLGGNVFLRVNGSVVTTGGWRADDIRLDSGETGQVPIRVAIAPDDRSVVLNAYREGRLMVTGEMFVRFRAETIGVDIGPQRIESGTADGGSGDE